MNVAQVITGMRPKTLIAALVPPLCALGLYYKLNDVLALNYFLLCLGLAVCIQIATNFYNYAIDFLKGADVNRIGPARITTQQKVNVKQVFWTGHFFLIMALLFGIPLVLKGGVIIGVLGVVSLALAYGYTGGPFPLAYLGLGELFVFLFFGLLATSGSYFIYGLEINLPSILLGTQIGLLSCVLIGVNNYRDRKSDTQVGKNTLATKLTDSTYLKILDLFLYIPYVLLIYFILYIDAKYAFNFISIVMALKFSISIRKVQSEDKLNDFLALSAKHLLFFSLLNFMLSLWK